MTGSYVIRTYSSNSRVLQPLGCRPISQLWLGDRSSHILTRQNLLHHLLHPLHPRNDPMSNTEVISMLQRMPQDQLGREAPSSTITQASSALSHGSGSWEWTCRHSLPRAKRHGQWSCESLDYDFVISGYIGDVRKIWLVVSNDTWKLQQARCSF